MRTINQLTMQEHAVLTLLAQGRRSAHIADELCISTRTVENHPYHIFDKLGVSSRTEAVVYALHNDLVSDSRVGAFPQDKMCTGMRMQK